MFECLKFIIFHNNCREIYLPDVQISQVQILQYFYQYQSYSNRIYNQQMHSSSSMFEGQINSRQKIAVFMVQKMIERRRNAASSQKFEKHSYIQKKNRFKQDVNKKTFTISYAEDNFVEHKSQDYRLKHYRQQINKVYQMSKSQEKTNASQKQTKNFRIKSYASINDGEIQKIAPLVLKYMRQTVQEQTRYQNNQEIQSQSNQFYGLQIRQVRTYKAFGKKQKIKQKLLQYEQNRKDKNDLAVHSSISLQIDKSHTSSKGGGFNVLAKRPPRSRSKFEDLQEGYLKTITCKKASLLSESMNSQQRKKQNISVHNIKFVKMINCLDVILNSFHLDLKKQIRGAPSTVFIQNGEKQISIDDGEKFTYFIGNGNNAQLIKSILKKRGWWTETSDVSKANFIWTQIKIRKIINRQPTISPQKSLVQPILCYQNDIKNDNPSNLLRTSMNFSTKRQEYTSLFNINKLAYQKLFHEKQSKKYYNPLSQIERRLRLQSVTKPSLYHNHFQFNHIIGNKNSLYFNLRLYYEFTKRDIKQIVPQTYYLEISNQKDLQQFERKFDPQTLWILKPGENSNRGQRITLAKSLQQIKLKLSIERKLIVQSYIKNPLLYNGRKFDIRTYLLGVNLNGRLKFYFYEQGYIKTSSYLYSLKDINDKYVHLTNDAIQQTSDKYGKYEEGNKLSYGEFQRYLQSKYQKQGYNVQSIHQQIRKNALQVVKATYHRINSKKKSFCFELFGLDYLIDSKFKPYLIEVNTNPCLELCSHSLERLIPRMIQSLFRLCLDPLFRPRYANNTKSESYYFYDERFLEKNQFRLIFDQRYDKDIPWQKFSLESQRRNEPDIDPQEEQII